MLRTLVDGAMPPEDSVACVQVQKENPGGGGEVLHQPDHPGLELPPLEAHPSQRLEAGQHVSLRTDGGQDRGLWSC